MNEIVDMAKAAGAGTSGVGIWYINEISAFVQLGVSVACLIYLVLKSIFLIKNKGKLAKKKNKLNPE